MFKRIWDHSFGYFDGKAFWEGFAGCFGATLGFLPLIVLILLLLR